MNDDVNTGQNLPRELRNAIDEFLKIIKLDDSFQLEVLYELVEYIYLFGQGEAFTRGVNKTSEIFESQLKVQDEYIKKLENVNKETLEKIKSTIKKSFIKRIFNVLLRKNNE